MITYDFILSLIAYVALTIFLIYSCPANATNNPYGYNRDIINGHIIYTVEYEGDEDKALFLAEAEAVRRIVVECKLPSKYIIIYDKKYDGFKARAQAGISFEECDKTKRSNNSKAVSKELVDNQRIYKKYLERKLLGSKKPKKVMVWKDNSKAIRKLSDKIDNLKINQTVTNNSTVYVKQYAANPNGTKHYCKMQYDNLMNQASIASLNSYPAGNMATGEAAKYYNQAQMIASNCR